MEPDLTKSKGSPAWVFWLILATIAAFGAVQVSLFWDRSLTIDEPFAANKVHLDWPQMFDIVWRQETPLYHVLLKSWVSFSGESEIALRSFSVLCFGLAIVTVGYTAGRIGGRWAGWAAAFLMSVSYVGLQHAATASKYALLGMQVSVATLLWFRLCELFDPVSPSVSVRERILFCVLLVGANMAGLLNHSIYLFFIVASSLAALLLPRPVFLALASCNLLSVAFHLMLWAPNLLQVIQTSATSWMQVPGIADLAVGVFRLWGNWRTLLVLSYLVVVSLAHWQRVKQFLRSKEGMVSATMSILLLALPFLVSQVKPVYFAVRTPALFLPMVCVFAGLLLVRLREPKLSSILLLLLGVASLWTCATAPPEELGAGPARASIRCVINKASRGDVVISAELASEEVTYYLRRFDAEGSFEHLTFPAYVNGHPAWFHAEDVDDSPESLAREARLTVDHLLEGDPSRVVWFFYYSSPQQENRVDPLKRELDRRMVLVETWYLRGSFFEQVLAYTHSL